MPPSLFFRAAERRDKHFSKREKIFGRNVGEPIWSACAIREEGASNCVLLLTTEENVLCGESNKPLPGRSDSASFMLALPLLGALLLYSGCATPLPPEAKAAIRSVSINKSVKVQVPSRESREPLKQAMLDGGIDPGEIFRKQFET